VPRASLTRVSDRELAGSWRPNEAEPIERRSTPNGRLFMSVDSHPELGYRIAVPWYGRHIVSRDGREIRSVLPGVPAWRWHRLLFAQVLPLSATLNGLTLFHASAVCVGDRVLAFVAGSGSGKSSVAMHLVSRGATFVTDDALALEPTAGGVLAHPGGGMASVDAAELRDVRSQGGAPVGDVLGRSDKVQVAIPTIDRTFPLGGLYFLQRRPKARSLRIVEQRPANPEQLLSSSFLTFLRMPHFLVSHLDVCARLAQSVPVYEISIPTSSSAHKVAGAIAEHAAP
jgi:hypothetical protein